VSGLLFAFGEGERDKELLSAALHALLAARLSIGGSCLLLGGKSFGVGELITRGTLEIENRFR